MTISDSRSLDAAMSAGVPIGARLALGADSADWRVDHTGGGCYAWACDTFDGGARVLIVDDDGGLGDERSESFSAHLDSAANPGEWSVTGETMAEAVKLAGMIQAARAFALGFRRLPTLAELETLAADARPVNDDDWGTERQIDAENAFFAACAVALPADFKDGGDFSVFAHKATTGEMIDEALRIVRANLAAPIPPYREAFPDFPASDFPAIPEGWRDASWRNDVCPSLYTHNNLQVFIECAAPADREFPECARYSVNLLDQYGYDGDDAVFASEDWPAVLEFVASFVTPAPSADQLAALMALATERANSEAIEAEMTKALETYCKVEGLPLMSADELRAELIGDNPEAANRAHVSYLTAFCAQWDAVASVTDAKHRAKAEAPAPVVPNEAEDMRAFLAAQYVERIGYDPFKDCPSITPVEVARTLIEHADAHVEDFASAAVFARDMLKAHMVSTFGPDEAIHKQTVFWEAYKRLCDGLPA